MDWTEGYVRQIAERLEKANDLHAFAELHRLGALENNTYAKVLANYALGAGYKVEREDILKEVEKYNLRFLPREIGGGMG